MERLWSRCRKLAAAMEGGDGRGKGYDELHFRSHQRGQQGKKMEMEVGEILPMVFGRNEILPRVIQGRSW